MIIAEIGNEKFELGSIKQAEALLEILGSAKPLDTSYFHINGKLTEVVHERENRYRGIDMSISPIGGIPTFEELKELRALSQPEKIDIPEPPATADITD